MNTFDFIPGPDESMQPNTEAFRSSAGLTDSLLLLAWAELFSLTKSHSRRPKLCAEVQRDERNGTVGAKANNMGREKVKNGCRTTLCEDN